MQTEEETATAEEPILEEGSEREQVKGRTFSIFVLSPFKRPVSVKVAHIAHLQHAPCIFTRIITESFIFTVSPTQHESAVVDAKKSRFPPSLSPSCVVPEQGHQAAPWLEHE